MLYKRARVNTPAYCSKNTPADLRAPVFITLSTDRESWAMYFKPLVKLVSFYQMLAHNLVAALIPHEAEALKERLK